MKVHFIAIGGAAMHNMALDLKASGWEVSGSDDEIYEPALSRLKAAGLCPEIFGWHASKISSDIDFVILGMHAKKDNPEMVKALEMGLKVVSYPEFLAQQSQHKKRIVVAGSHGKTTTTSIILHVLKSKGLEFDYLVGSLIEGFDRMVKLSDAPLIVIEGDEYLSSPIDLTPKIHHYHPHISIITGIAWDHINVFPTFEIYKAQFVKYIDLHAQNAHIYYDETDTTLSEIIGKSTRKDISYFPYSALSLDSKNDVVLPDGSRFLFPLIGLHNQKNTSAALAICLELGISKEDFFLHLQSFTGAKKRLQVLWNSADSKGFLDFAHAPSKVMATVNSVKNWFKGKKLIAFFELHTFSSLNQEFLSQYAGSLSDADEAIVFVDEHTLESKNMPSLQEDIVLKAFGSNNVIFIKDRELLHQYITNSNYKNAIALFMSSGTFGGYNFKSFVEKRI